MPPGGYFEGIDAMAKLIVNGREVEMANGVSLLAACHGAGVYVPSLCHHPDLPPFSACEPSGTVYRSQESREDDDGGGSFPHCGLCAVEIEGEDAPVLACETTVADGMRVRTDSEIVRELRRKNFAAVFSGHPKLCIVCPFSGGCDRLSCSVGTPVEQRCCDKFNYCELRKVAQYVGLNRDLQHYTPKSVPKIKGGNLFEYDFGLCIGCLRCIRACKHVQGTAVIGFVRRGGEALVGTLKPTLVESGCKFCGACVAVCPTGAMMPTSEKCGSKLTLTTPMMPPLGHLDFVQEAVDGVPEEEGVVQLFDAAENVIYICGTANMRKELQQCIKTADGAKYFLHEKDAMFSQKQNELIQHYIDSHGKQPRINEELDDLF